MQNKSPLNEYIMTADENIQQNNEKENNEKEFRIEDNIDYTQSNDVLEYEQDLSEPALIVTIESGCPICFSDLKGNAEQGFYCEKCNLIFTQADLIHLGIMSRPYYD